MVLGGCRSFLLLVTTFELPLEQIDKICCINFLDCGLMGEIHASRETQKTRDASF